MPAPVITSSDRARVMAAAISRTLGRLVALPVKLSFMAQAIYNGSVIATSDDVEVVEGNVYFPRDAVRDGVLVDSDHTSVCPWKGTAHYHHVQVGEQRSDNAAWYYPDPKPAAGQIADRIAFWKGVEVQR